MNASLSFLEWLQRVRKLTPESAASYVAYIDRINGWGLDVTAPGVRLDVEARTATFPKKSQQNIMSAMRALSAYIRPQG